MNPAVTVVLVVGNYRDRAQRVLHSVLAQDIADQILILFYDRADRPAIATGLLLGYRNSRLQFTKCETNIARAE